MRPARRTTIPFLVIVIVFALVMVACQQPGVTPTPGTSGLWSDPDTWGGTVPLAGDAVVIPEDSAITLDVSPPPLAGLTISGTLRFADTDLELSSDYVVITGMLQIGSEGRPYRHQATITLTGDAGEDVMGMGSKVLAVMGEGRLELHGEDRAGWTRLAATAAAGATTITLEQAMDWRRGDRIVIASTDFDFEQAEAREIVAVAGATITLDQPLDVEHFGELQSYAGITVDERAEVGLLSRNIVIQGDDRSEDDGVGGHLMIMEGGSAHVSGIELYRMGQRGRLARYPFHWHLAGDRAGDYLADTSIHHSFNRCVTVHGTHNVRVAGVVAYDAFGHCFFLEDAIETGNTFENNLGLVIRRPAEADALLPTDAAFQGPAVFWITNPDNRYRDNVAAGSQGSGFWLALPEHPTGPSATDTVFPRRTPLLEFRGNVSHSNGDDGLHVDRGPNTATLESETTYYTPLANPADPDSAEVWAEFRDFTGYKNRGNAVWLRGRRHRLIDAVLADNAVGVTMASSDSYVTDTLFVGESANLGTPRPWEVTGPDGRSLPRPWTCDNCADKTIRGFELYDGTVWGHGNTFTQYVPNALRQAAAISQLDFSNFVVSPHNYLEDTTVTPESTAVYFESRALPSDPNAGEDGYRSTVFEDRDGSLSGTPGTQITVDNPFLTTGACSFVAAWNAWTCPERYVRLALDTLDVGGLSPVSVSRSGGGSHTMLGQPGVLSHFSTSALEGESYAYTFGGATPDRLRLLMWYAEPGDTVRVDLPYPYPEAYLYRDWWIDSRNLLTEAASLAELEASSGGHYFLAGGTLHLKLVVQADRPWAVVDVCRYQGCP